MLTEEVDSFSCNDQDVGCAPELELDMKLTDDKPVQKSYGSIPRPLYGKSEVILRTYKIISL